jgi:hypothetical protein
MTSLFPLLIAFELARYIDRFEERYRDTRAVPWGLPYGIARPVGPYQKGIHITVTTRDDAKSRGMLLYIDENLLILSKAKTCPACLADSEETAVIFSEEIKQVRDQWPVMRRIFYDINIPGAGNEDIYASYTMRSLQKRTAFRSVPSPEIRKLIESSTASERPRLEPVIIDRQYLRRFSNKMHIALSAFAASQAISFPAYTDKMYQSDHLKQHTTPPVASLAFQVDYSANPHWRVGAGSQPRQSEPDGRKR